jgi:hypothetical protein
LPAESVATIAAAVGPIAELESPFNMFELKA